MYYELLSLAQSKSCGVNIQMKPLWQYFHKVLFIQHDVLTFESFVYITLRDHSNETGAPNVNFRNYLFGRRFEI